VKRVAAVLQASGVALLAAAGWLVSPSWGLAVAGVGMVAFGVAAERDG
jgi:hypothetical protein